MHHLELSRWPETPDEVSWLQVDEWDGARRGDFAAAAEFARTIKDAVAR